MSCPFLPYIFILLGLFRTPKKPTLFFKVKGWHFLKSAGKP